MWSNKWLLGRQSWWTWPHLCSSFLEKRWNIRDCSFWSWHCDGYFWSRYSITFIFYTLNEIILTQGCGENEWKRWVAFVRGTTLGSIQGCSKVLSGDYLSKHEFFRMNFVCQKIETVSVSFPIFKHDFLGSTWSSSTGGGSRWSKQDSNFNDRGKYENIGGHAGWFWKYDKLI